MQKKWIKFLVDPATGRPLKLKIDVSRGEEILSGKLISGENVYPIIRGIPKFVEDSFWGKSKVGGSDKLQTSASFGDKWQSDLLKINFGAVREQLLAMLGVANERELKKLFNDGMNCLDAGCGVAWSEYLFNVNKNTNRFAVDLSLSVEAAYQKTKNIANVFVGQADLLRMPFKKKFFDIIFSADVLHHTGDARKAFGSLADYLKPGGLFGIYIYCKKPFLRELADEKIREVTTGMTFDHCLKFSRQFALFGKSLQKIKQPLVIESDVPLLGIKRGKYDLQKFIFDHFVKCFYNQKFGYENSALVNLDWYHPRYASHHSREEVGSWFRESGFSRPRFIQPKGWEHSGYFVSGRKFD